MEIMKICKELFPINRCISGNGLRDSLNIINRYVPLQITEFPTGEDCFGWELPMEWNIKDAYVTDKSGMKLIDFKENNLHILAYSIPFDGWVSREELLEHLYSVKEMPDAIPYITSVYGRRWGFCIEDKKIKIFTEEKYYVKIDSILEEGSISIGEALLKGESEKEIIFFTYTGHPSMANDQLSGILTLILIHDQISKMENELYYSYRFIFCPETIGTAAYLKHNLKKLKKDFLAGYSVTFTGDKNPLKYMRSLEGDSIGDIAAAIALRNGEVIDFSPFGSDERHFNAPGIELPFGAFMRAGPRGYKEYHTSLDDLSIICEENLCLAADTIVETIKDLEAERIIEPIHMGFEPKLDKLDLYPTLGKKYGKNELAHEMLAIWRLSRKYHSLLEIAQVLGCNAHSLSEALTKAEDIKLVKSERGIE